MPDGRPERAAGFKSLSGIGMNWVGSVRVSTLWGRRPLAVDFKTLGTKFGSPRDGRRKKPERSRELRALLVTILPLITIFSTQVQAASSKQSGLVDSDDAAQCYADGSYVSASASNEEALMAFALLAGDSAPKIVNRAEGIKLEWRGTVSIDGYRSRIGAPLGSEQIATALQPGNLGRLVFSTDIRLVEPNGASNFFQGSLTASNDRAVLSRYSSQVTTLQLGRSSPRYNVSAGDIAANYSGLGSSLGLRGITLSQKLGDWTFSGHGGVVAESWEALLNHRPLDGGSARNQFLRNVRGVKTEYAWNRFLRLYATLQGFDDRASTLPIERVSLPAAATRSASAGLAYQSERATLTGELAKSRFVREQDSERIGVGWVLDGSYRWQTLSLRAGYHDVGPEFVSLAQTVPAGIKESYLGADWTATPWLSLGADVRDSKTRFARPFVPSPLNPSDDFLVEGATLNLPVAPAPTLARGFNGRATINFGANWPGWNLSLQNSESDSRDSQGNPGRSRSSNAGLAFSLPIVNGNLSISDGYSRNAAYPAADSKSRGWQFQFSRLLTRNYADGSPNWSINGVVVVGRQVQTIVLSHAKTQSQMLGLNFSGQHARLGQFNFQWNDTKIAQPFTEVDLTTRTFQLDLTHPLAQGQALKGYMRHVHRNMGDPKLEAIERLGGVQFNITW